MEISRFGHKEWLKLWNNFQRWSRGNDEDLCCFVVLFQVNNELHIMIEASNSTPYLYCRVSLT